MNALFASQKMDSVNYKKIISHIRFAASDYIPSHQFLSNLVKRYVQIVSANQRSRSVYTDNVLKMHAIFQNIWEHKRQQNFLDWWTHENSGWPKSENSTQKTNVRNNSYLAKLCAVDLDPNRIWKKCSLLKIITVTKFLLFTVKCIIDRCCLFDDWYIYWLYYPNGYMKIFIYLLLNSSIDFFLSIKLLFFSDLCEF